MPSNKSSKQGQTNTSAESNTSYEFTGGKGLKGFKKLMHDVLMQNELRDGKGAYRISDADAGKSGYSFGGNQMDLLNGGNTPRVIFRDILTNYKEKNDGAIKIDDVIRTVTSKDKKLTKLEENFINTALSSEYGRKKIDEIYVKELTKKIAHVENLIEKISDPSLKAKLQDDHVKVILVDYHNQFGLNKNHVMHNFIQGKTVLPHANKNSNKTMTLDPKKDIKTQLRDLIKASEFGMEPKGKEDIARRQGNIDKVLQAHTVSGTTNSTKNHTTEVPTKPTATQGDNMNSNSNTSQGQNNSTEESPDQYLTDLGMTNEQKSEFFSWLNQLKPQEKEKMDLPQMAINMKEVVDYIRAEKEHRAQQQVLQNINQFLDVTDEIGRRLDCKPLVQVAGVAKSFVAAKQALEQLKQAEALAKAGSNIAAGAAFGCGVGAIVGVAFTLIDMFGSKGPDPTTLILEQLGGLSQQIADLQKVMIECFNEVFKMEREILKTVQEGFATLSKQLNERVFEVQVEMRARLENIQQTLNSFIVLNKLDIKDVLTLKFRNTCNSAENFIQGVSNGQCAAAQLPKLSNDLANHAVVLATRPSLNGDNVWAAIRSGNQELLQDVERANNFMMNSEAGNFLNYFVGCLTGYYSDFYKYVQKKPLPKELSEATNLMADGVFANAEVWYGALDKYIAINKSYTNFDHDPADFQRQQMVNIGIRGQKWITIISNDKDYGQYLIDEYYKTIEEAKDAVIKYGQWYTDNKIRKVLDEKYTENEVKKPENYRQEKIPSFNLLIDSPEKVATFFEKRTINYFPFGINLIDNIGYRDDKVPFACSTGRLRDIQLLPLYRLFNDDKHRLPASHLLAEYFGLIVFTARQTEGISGIKWRNQIAGDDPSDNKYATFPRRGDLNALHPTFVDTEWNFPLELNIQLKSDFFPNSEPKKIANLCYRGGWNYFRTIEKGLWTLRTPMLQQQGDIYWHEFQNAHEEEKVACAMREAVATCWDSTKEIIQPSHVDMRVDEKQKKQILQGLKAWYSIQRRSITYNLLKSDESDFEPGETISNEWRHYRAVLKKLDLKVQMLLWFINLTGKEVPANNPLRNLITANKIYSELAEYINPDAHKGLQYPLSASLWQICEQPKDSRELQYTVIANLAEFALTKLPKYHPKRLFAAGIHALEMYRVWKTLIKEKFPVLKSFTNIETYNAQCALLREEFVTEEGYTAFKDLYAKNFKSKRLKIKNWFRYFSEINESEYPKLFMGAIQWATDDSKVDTVTGALAANIRDITELRNLEQLRFMAVRQWENNIAYLMRVATLYGNCDFKGNVPTNFLMWADGLICFLQLINNERFEEIAKRVGNTAKEKLNGLLDILKVGYQFKHSIYSLCLSTEMANRLFQLYVDRLRDFQQDLGAKKRENLNIATIKRDIEEGVIWRELDAYAATFKFYLQVLFAEELEEYKDDPEFVDGLLDVVKGRFAFSDMLAPPSTYLQSNTKYYSMDGNFVNYLKAVNNLHVRVLEKIEMASEQLYFYQYLQKCLSANTKTLFLSSQQLQDNFTLEKLKTLGEYLALNPLTENIVITNLSGITLKNSRTLIDITNLYVKKATIQFNDCMFPKEVREFLQGLKQENIIIEDNKANTQQLKKNATKEDVKSLLTKILDDEAQYFTQLPNPFEKRQPYLMLDLHVGPSLLGRVLRLAERAKCGLEQKLSLENKLFPFSEEEVKNITEALQKQNVRVKEEVKQIKHRTKNNTNIKLDELNYAYKRHSIFASTPKQMPIPENIHQSASNTQVQIEGLIYQPIPGNGHCLYNAVGLYLGKTQKYLRGIVAANLEHNIENYRDFIPLSNGKSIEDYINDVRKGIEWATHVEIEVLMCILDRPILVIDACNNVMNASDAQRFSGAPIFVYYNGHNHYDSFLLKEGFDSRNILQTLLTRSTNGGAAQPPTA